jgi:hypothetical protein
MQYIVRVFQTRLELRRPDFKWYHISFLLVRVPGRASDVTILVSMALPLWNSNRIICLHHLFRGCGCGSCLMD